MIMEDKDAKKALLMASKFEKEKEVGIYRIGPGRRRFGGEIKWVRGSHWRRKRRHGLQKDQKE